MLASHRLTGSLPGLSPRTLWIQNMSLMISEINIPRDSLGGLLFFDRKANESACNELQRKRVCCHTFWKVKQEVVKNNWWKQSLSGGPLKNLGSKWSHDGDDEIDAV